MALAVLIFSEGFGPARNSYLLLGPPVMPHTILGSKVNKFQKIRIFAFTHTMGWNSFCGGFLGQAKIGEHCQRPIEIINNKARHNLINVKYCQMARWCCSQEFFGTLWSNESDAQPPEGDATKFVLICLNQIQATKTTSTDSVVEWWT